MQNGGFYQIPPNFHTIHNLNINHYTYIYTEENYMYTTKKIY